MIKKLTNHILSYLISSNAINDNEETKDYYRYGIEITISSLINILLIIIIGIVSGNALESIVFLACFIPLRQFTGGFHAKTYFLCNLSFAVSFIILLIVYKFTNQYVTSYIVFLIIIFSCIIFFSECPVENKNTASAYSPTITKSFGSSAKATLYADSSYAYGTTTCSGKDCTVSVTYHGTTKYGSGYGYANAKNSASGSGTRASSYHTAGGYSTNISY